MAEQTSLRQFIPEPTTSLMSVEGLSGYTQQNPLPGDERDRQEAARELSRRGITAQAPVPSNQSVMAAPTSINPFNPAFRETARSALNDFFGGSNIAGREGYRTGQLVDTAVGAMDFIPGVGDAVGVGDLRQSIGSGDLIGTAVDTTALAAGMIPVVGDAAAKGIKTGESSLRRYFGGDIPEIGRDSTLLGRVGDVRRVNEMDVEMSAPQLTSFPLARAEDLIDRAYMTGITDTSRPGLERVTAVNGVPVDSLQRGGFGFGMQPNNIDRGIAFASAENAVRAQLNRARQAQSLSGRPGVIFAPHGMVGPSPDFATMSTDIAVPYAQRVLSQSDKNILDKRIREGTDSKAALIPDFPGIDRATPEYLSSIGGKRKSILQALDEKGPQEAGALSRSQIRAIVTEPSEVDAPFGQVNAFYELNPDYYAGTNPLDPVMSDHPSYAFALSGRPIGLAREGFSIFDLDPSIFGVDKRPAANFMDLLAQRRMAAEQSLSDMRLKGVDSEELGKASGKLKGYDFPGLYGDGNYGSSVQGMIKAGGQGRITQEMVDDLLRRGLIID